MSPQTNVVIIEAPFTTHVSPVAHGLFLLSDNEINLRSISREILLVWLQIDSVAVALIIPIDVDNHG